MLLGGLLTGSAGPGWAQSSIFTCTDAKGRRLTSDRPIPECLDRAQRELNPSGTLRRVVEPSMTAQERSYAEAQMRKASEEEARKSGDRRRERALLMRYPDRASHDKERAAAFKQVDDAILTAQQRSSELAQQRKKLDADASPYRANPSKMPPTLRQQIDLSDQFIAAQQRSLAEQQAEKQRLKQRFDAELEVLGKLWGPAAAGTP